MNRLSRINHENLQIQKNIFNKFIVQKKKEKDSIRNSWNTFWHLQLILT